jgi:hypothetical protein
MNILLVDLQIVITYSISQSWVAIIVRFTGYALYIIPTDLQEQVVNGVI